MSRRCLFSPISSSTRRSSSSIRERCVWIRLCWFWTIVVSSFRYRIACIGFSSRLELIILRKIGCMKKGKKKLHYRTVDRWPEGWWGIKADALPCTCPWFCSVVVEVTPTELVSASSVVSLSFALSLSLCLPVCLSLTLPFSPSALSDADEGSLIQMWQRGGGNQRLVEACVITQRETTAQGRTL